MPDPTPRAQDSVRERWGRRMNFRSSASRWVYPAAIAVLIAGMLTVAFAVIQPTPPRSVVFSTGPPGSSYQRLGERYRERFAEDGVELILRPSAGAGENLEQLGSPGGDVQAGFAPMGPESAREYPELRALGAFFYEPLWVFQAGPVLEGRLPSSLSGIRIAVSEEGSLSHFAALRLLELLDVSLTENQLLELGEAEAAERLEAGEVDLAVFAVDAASPVIEKLLSSEAVDLLNFSQADAYIARYPALTRLTVPAGVGSLARRRPPEDVTILAFTGTLFVRESLHPAIQSLFLDAATEIHAPPDIFHTQGRFPRPETVGVPLSDAADRFYRSGRPFLQRYLPFWMAVLVMQLVAFLLPLLGIVYPLARFFPSLFGWAMRRRITRLYGELRLIEMVADTTEDPAERARLTERLESLDRKVGRLRLPESFAPLVYTLRLHIDVVRSHFEGTASAAQQ